MKTIDAFPAHAGGDLARFLDISRLSRVSLMPIVKLPTLGTCAPLPSCSSPPPRPSPRWADHSLARRPSSPSRSRSFLLADLLVPLCDCQADPGRAQRLARSGGWFAAEDTAYSLVVAAIKPVVVSPDALPTRCGILASTSGGHPGAVRRTRDTRPWQMAPRVFSPARR